MNKIIFLILTTLLFNGCVFEDSQEEGKAWTDGIVYYEIDEGIHAFTKGVILECMNEIESKTNVKFIESCEVPYRLKIYYANINEAIVGMRNKNYLTVDLFANSYVITHELGHVLGLRHEHQRIDRDSYIKINYENIQENMFFAFEKIESSMYNMEAYDYDLKSIMHYHEYDFAKSYHPVFEVLEGEYTPSFELSEIDIAKINDIYN